MADEENAETREEQPAEPGAEQSATTGEEATQDAGVAEDATPEVSPGAEEIVAEGDEIVAEGEEIVAEAPSSAPAEAEQAPVAAGEAAEAEVAAVEDEDEEPPAREKPSVPGAHLEVDIVPEGVDPLSRGEVYEDAYAVDPYAIDEEVEEARDLDEEEREEVLAEPISTAAIDLASGARYRATGKRKSAIARVTLRPGSGSYLVNGRTLEEHFPRLTLQRNIRQPLETVGYQDRMDVVARLHGGGISAQAGALRHGVSRALLEADPNLRGELKRRGFLTRDSRAKERKKAGLKKARKRPQFSKR
jgi:small subunit ribosomal protein S9